MHNLTAKCAFITKENINGLISDEINESEIGLLHIDIDGNDYWVWESLDYISPDIVIVEYNSVFGPTRSITIPYDPNFVRSEAHYSNLYAGASIMALCDLGESKGYHFVGCNSAANNAYFVKKSKMNMLKSLSEHPEITESKFRECRDEEGKLNYCKPSERIEVLRGMPVYNTRTDEIEVI